MCFFWVDVKSSIAERLQDSTDVAFVFLKGIRPDYNVIKVNVTNFSDQGAQCSRYLSLVNCWGILEALGHDKPLVKAQGSVYRCQVNVVRVHPCLKEAVCHNDCAPNFTFGAIVENVIYSGERMGIHDRVFIKLMKIVNPTR